MSYSTLKSDIEAAVYPNGEREVTALMVQNVLKEMADVLGAGYQFMGVASPDTTPPATDAKMFYLAAAGTYTAFGLTVSADHIGVFTYNGTWACTELEVGSGGGGGSTAGGVFFGTSSTAASTTQKEVSIPEITTLQTGQIIVVHPSTTSTVANSTIKLNNFAAYAMRYNGAAITTSTDSIVWNSAYPSMFVFDGTYWVFLTHGVDSNTTYSAMSVEEGTTGTETSLRTIRADYLKQIIQGIVPVVDNLTSTSTTSALSAAQGKALNEGKADMVTGATSGNLAGLDADGNLTDSGSKPGDFQPALATQTAYTAKGSATKVAQISTNSLGQVTGISEVTISQPTVYNKTITLQANGATVDSFTTNPSANKTIDFGNLVKSGTAGLKIEVVASMPATPDANTIYIVT